jgi:hypothetical protein
MYMGDRTHVFGKMAKQFDPVTFAGLNAAALFVGLMTLKFKDSSSDAGFLNRDQTDEWKGWMQLAILIYHFVGASRTAGIYNPVRVLVAAYLFQTGYGHFHFFYKKADFGIARVLNIMVRLNLLTCILAYSMNTNYLFYYFSPLCSFWFAVIWICMRVGYRYNDRAWFILTKIVISGIATGAIIHYPGILETVFDLLSWAFKIDWDVVDWRFRLGLDAWIVYIGMICAYVSIRLTQAKVTSTYPTMWKAVEHISVALSVIGLYWFFSFELTLSKASYSSYHPYISWIPILSFVCLRNCTVFLRNTHSRFFALIGKMSLETYIGQFHMWLAADTQGLLVVIPSASYAIQSSFGWYLNLGLSSLIFFCVCHHLSKATGTITRVVCSGVSEQKSKDTYLQLPIHELPVPLLPTSTQTEQQEITVADETHVLIEESKSLDESSIIYEDSRPKAKWYSLLVNNYWIRSLLMLTLLGIINRFCS